MKYKLTGVSTPFGGLSWDKELSEKDRIIFLFTYLESKRIIYNPAAMEKKEWCIESVLEIKSSLVDITKDIKMCKKSLTAINDMIDACNHYLDSISQSQLNGIIYKNSTDYDEVVFYRAMNNFRDNIKKNIDYFEKTYDIKFRKEIPKAW